jgi:hypothetical protein
VSRVRFVATHAALVAGGRGLLLGAVAAAAGERRGRRVRHFGAVTRHAQLVTWVRRHERRLARMALAAQCLLAQPGERVRLVAPLTSDAPGVRAGVEHGHLHVAARARRRDDG